MNENELKFVVSCYDYSGKLIGDKLSFVVDDKSDIIENETPLFDHMFLALEEFKEGAI